MGAISLHHLADAAADHHDRHPVLGHLHFRRFPASLRADSRRSGERHATVCDLRVRYRDERRPARARGFGGAGDAAGAGAPDRGANPLSEEGVMVVSGQGRLRQAIRVWLPIGFFLVVALFPFYWMAITSIKPNSELYNKNVMPLIVHAPTLKHYVDLLTQSSFLLWTWNTMVVAVISTAISLILGT